MIRVLAIVAALVILPAVAASAEPPTGSSTEFVPLVEVEWTAFSGDPGWRSPTAIRDDRPGRGVPLPRRDRIVRTTGYLLYLGDDRVVICQSVTARVDKNDDPELVHGCVTIPKASVRSLARLR